MLAREAKEITRKAQNKQTLEEAARLIGTIDVQIKTAAREGKEYIDISSSEYKYKETYKMIKKYYKHLGYKVNLDPTGYTNDIVIRW